MSPHEIFNSRDARDRVDLLMQIMVLLMALHPRKRKFKAEAGMRIRELRSRSLLATMQQGSMRELEMYRNFLESKAGGRA